MSGTEQPVVGVTVNLRDAGGNVVSTTVTNVNGVYRFDDLAPGDYLIEIVPPAGDQLTTANQGDDATDSDFSSETNFASVTVLADQTVRNIDAGLVQTPTTAAPATSPPLALTGAESRLIVLLGSSMVSLGVMLLLLSIGLLTRSKEGARHQPGALS